MNWFDFAILGVIAFSTLGGRTRGLRAVAPFAGVIAATFIAGKLYEQLADSLSTIVTNDTDARVVAFLAIFAAVYLAAELISAISGPFMALLLFAPGMGMLGMLFGLLAGALMVDTLLIFLVTYPSLGLEGAVQGSMLAPYFVDSFPVMRFLLPNEFDAAAAAFS